MLDGIGDQSKANIGELSQIISIGVVDVKAVKQNDHQNGVSVNRKITYFSTPLKQDRNSWISMGAHGTGRAVEMNGSNVKIPKKVMTDGPNNPSRTG